MTLIYDILGARKARVAAAASEDDFKEGDEEVPGCFPVSVGIRFWSSPQTKLSRMGFWVRPWFFDMCDVAPRWEHCFCDPHQRFTRNRNPRVAGGCSVQEMRVNVGEQDRCLSRLRCRDRVKPKTPAVMNCVTMPHRRYWSRR